MISYPHPGIHLQFPRLPPGCPLRYHVDRVPVSEAPVFLDLPIFSQPSHHENLSTSNSGSKFGLINSNSNSDFGRSEEEVDKFL